MIESSKEYPCTFCKNHKILQEVDVDYFNTCVLGNGNPDTMIHLVSGQDMPTRIEVDTFNKETSMWETSATYYPKFCPECGRELNEYTISKLGDYFIDN